MRSAIRATVLAATAALALGAAGAAAAAIHTITFTGVLTGGSYDNGGYFGGVADGDAFVAKFRLNDDVPAAQLYFDPAVSYMTAGGDQLTFDLTINGHTVHYGASGGGQADQYIDPDYGDGYDYYVNGGTYDGNGHGTTRSISFSGTGMGFLSNPDFRTLTGEQAMAADSITGSFYFNNFSFGGGCSCSGAYAQGSFDVTGVTIAIPEPGTWALMTLGFGGLGAAFRHSRRRAFHPAH